MDIIDTSPDNLYSFWENHKYDDEILEMLYKRRKDHLEGIDHAFSVEDTIDYIKSYRKT